MGLKTTNYVSKSTGLVLPEAYAAIRKISVDLGIGSALLAIQTSRERALDKSYKAVDEVHINFTWDRKTDPAKMAYEAAKTQAVWETEYNKDGSVKARKIKEYGVLYGWDNDFV